MGAPVGNKNAAKGKMWANALTRALDQYEADGVQRGNALRKIADRLISKALEGDMAAIKEFGDRIDGKSVIQVDGDGALFHITISRDDVGL